MPSSPKTEQFASWNPLGLHCLEVRNLPIAGQNVEKAYSILSRKKKKKKIKQIIKKEKEKKKKGRKKRNKKRKKERDKP